MMKKKKIIIILQKRKKKKKIMKINFIVILMEKMFALTKMI
jgi:hypothetical protein